MVRALGSWCETVLELLFPPRCQVCGTPDGFPLCEGCARQLRRIVPPVCQVCGRPLRGPEALVFTCVPCRRPGPIARLRAYGIYDGQLREAVHAFKFRKKAALATPLGHLLAEVVREDPVLSSADAIVPVPLHPRREAERGFNQADELGQVVSRVTGLRLVRGLVRVRPTAPQFELDEAERRRNVRGAFAVRAGVLGLRVLLVDDVVTTGSTLRECARALRRAGSPEVLAAVVAMTVRDP